MIRILKKEAAKIILLLFLFLGSALVVSGYLSLHPQAEDLPAFVLGRWAGSCQDYFGEDQVCQLEFLKSGSLVVSRLGGKFSEFNVDYDYTLSEDNQIMLTGRVGGASFISRKNDNLIIKKTLAIVNITGAYTRKPFIEWIYVALMLGLAIIMICFVHFSDFTRRIKQTQRSYVDTTGLRWKGLLAFILLADILMFWGGWKFADQDQFIWRNPYLISIRLPWDSVITVELALLIIIGVISLSDHPLMKKFETPFRRTLLNFGKMFFSGMGAMGIFFGAIKIFAFFILSYHYPS